MIVRLPFKTSFRNRLNESGFRFDADDDFDDEEEFTQPIEHSNKIKLAGYTWSKIGKLNGHDLYLCDENVTRLPFSNRRSRTNNWKRSDIREWLNTDFYSNFSIDEKREIVENEDGDNIFLLSLEEHDKFVNKIKVLDKWWWLRSPGGNSNFAAYVTHRGDHRGDSRSLGNLGYSVDRNGGIRPALLLK